MQALHLCCARKFVDEALRSLPARPRVLLSGSTPLHAQVASRFCPPANLQRGAGHKASSTTGTVLQLFLLLLPLLLQPRRASRCAPCRTLRSLQHPAAAAAAAAAAGNWLHAAVHLTLHPPCCLELQRRTAPLA